MAEAFEAAGRPMPGARDAKPSPQEGMDVNPEESSASEAGVQEESPPSANEEKPSPQPPEQLSEKSQNRFQQLANQNKELEAQLLAAREEARKLREETSASKVLELLKQDRPKGFDDWSEDDRQAYTAHQAAKVSTDQAIAPEMRAQLRKILLKDFVADSLPEHDRKQVAAIAEVLDSLDNRISVQDAAAVAAHRNPDLFAQAASGKKQGAKGDPASFHSQRPTQGRDTARSLDKQIDELKAAAASARTPTQRMKIAAEVNKLSRMRAQRRS